MLSELNIKMSPSQNKGKNKSLLHIPSVHLYSIKRIMCTALLRSSTQICMCMSIIPNNVSILKTCYYPLNQ